MRQWLVSAAVSFAVCAGVVVGCNSSHDDSSPGASSGDRAVIDVKLTANTVASLPTCTASLVGTTAYVTSPSGLWTCAQQGNHYLWQPIPCTSAQSGTVAYASATQQLWACIGSQWTSVALPPGPPGPQGDAGPESLVSTTTEPPGPNCPEGGVRIDVGVDTNGDGVLEPSEVQHTSYVCNGLPAGVTADGGVAPCVQGQLQCAGQQPQTCTASATWQNTGPACGSVNQTCVGGACVGACTSGTTQCQGNGVQTCGPNGEWGTAVSCTTGIPNGTATCSNGACTGFTCNSGYTLCGSSSCLDLQTDPNNCGACGHGCQGGACTNGMCPAVTLASFSWDASGVATDGTNVYWTQYDNTGTNGSVWEVPVSGGSPVALVSGGLVEPNSIAIDASNVYWLDLGGNTLGNGSLMSIPKSGGAATTLASHLGNPLALAVSGGTVVWTDRDLAGPGGYGPVLSIPVGGGAVTTLIDGQNEPGPIAASSTTVYWGTLIGAQMLGIPLGGGSPTVYFDGSPASPPVYPSDVATDSANAYYVTRTGSVVQIPFASGQPLYVGAVPNYPAGIASDGTAVYVAVSTGVNSVQIYELPLATGTPLLLAQSFTSKAGNGKMIAVDGTSVYWVGPDSIMKTAK